LKEVNNVNANRLVVSAAAVLSLSVAGCRCGGGTVNDKPDFIAMPTAMSFSACPSQDETGMTVKDVFPDEQKVTIQNNGKAPGSLSATLSGADAARFTLDPNRTPMSIAAGDTIDLPVQFSPLKKGDARATLTIDDGEMTTDPITVDLVGTGKNLPPQPTIEAALEDYASPGTFTQTCKDGSTAGDCTQGYPDTLLMDSTSLKIKLRNTGCPALKITGIDLSRSGAGSTDSAFYLDQPATLPSSMNPLVMSTADGTAEVTLLVRFAPQPAMPPDVQRISILTITSNDPVTPSLVIALQGNGVSPAIYAVPTFCNFTDPNDLCRPPVNDGGMKLPNTALFEISNSGTTNVTIDSVKFKSSGNGTASSDMRFKIMTPIDGTVLNTTDKTKVTLVVQHDDQPLFVIDQLIVSASPATAGKIFLTVAGGTAPCLDTDPLDTLNFDNPTADLTTKSVMVKALATRPGSSQPCGDLIVDGVDIPANPFFTLVPPLLDAGTRIAKGGQAQINVQYKKPITGGQQAGDLVIMSNDLDYGAPAYKKLLLQSKSPLNELPVCVLKGCLPAMTDCSTMGSMGSMLVSLSQTFGGGAKNITVWGGDSYDPGNPMMPGISAWKFQVLPPSPNVSGWSLPNNGLYTSMNSGTLTLDPSATGLYKVFLYVKDDSGQQSAQACELRITVNQ
jgi:hypothetical protein